MSKIEEKWIVKLEFEHDSLLRNRRANSISETNILVQKQVHSANKTKKQNYVKSDSKTT